MLWFRVLPLVALLQLCSAQLVAQRFHQTRFEVIPERAMMTWMNRSQVSVAELYSYSYNRTLKVANLTLDFLHDVHDLKSASTFYRYNTANIYVKTAIQFTLDICAAIKLDIFGFALARTQGNFTVCPIKKGFYRASNIYVTDDKLPPSIPEGRYKWLNIVYLDGIHSYDFEIYAEIRYLVRRNKMG